MRSYCRKSVQMLALLAATGGAIDDVNSISSWEDWFEEVYAQDMRGRP